MAHAGLRFGIFLAPFHQLGDNPTLALERDLELIEWLDHLGYDEAWIGEHHSAGWEIIASPEIFIAAAAQRTKRIMLGSGVTSLPYHHPFLVAQRFVQLDHMTRGRAMLGCGPGALVSDAYMMGIEAEKQRTMMDESLGAIMRLLEGKEPVTLKTDWFELKEARLHLAPYTKGCFPIVWRWYVVLRCWLTGRPAKACRAMEARRRAGGKIWQDHESRRLAPGGQHPCG